MSETKIIYHIDEEETPYLVKLPIPPDQVTLADFKNVLNRPSYKFFFKSMDDDFGVVKEEIVDDDAKLPCFNGRVISWLVSADGSSVSDSVSQCTDSLAPSEVRGGSENRPTQTFRPPGPHGRAVVDDFTTTETESVVSSRRSDLHILHRSSVRQHREDYENYDRFDVGPALPRLNGHPHSHPHAHGIHGLHSGKQRSSSHGYESSSMLSSDLESTSFVDSEEDASSRITTTTERSSVSRAARHRRPRRRRPRMPPMSRTSSFSSITDSTMSLNIITVTLNMDSVNFLGISIVGQSHKGGDGGIYVGSIMKGGAVALDGRIEPGDMILQVNDINFENMSNDDAVRVLREVVQKPGPIKLVVAKCWDPHPKGYFTIPRTEPVRPIDPGAWVAHTEAARGGLYPNRPPSVTTMTSSSSLISSLPESELLGPPEDMNLTVHTDMGTIVRAMAQPDSGLEIRDRMWLKIVIPNAFIGADVVDWLHTHVQGFEERRDARKYASQLLKAGYIRHTVNKITFSEQCYYVFGDLCGGMASLRLHDPDSVSEADRDMLCPLPPPAGSQTGSSGGAGWGGIHMPYAGTFQPSPASGYAPMPFSYSSDAVAGYAHPYGNGTNSVNSGSGSSNGSDGRGGNIGLGIGLVDRQSGSGLVGAINPIGPGVHGSTGSGSGSHSGSASTASSDGDSQRSERSRRTLTGHGQAGLGLGVGGAAGVGLPPTNNLRPLGQVPADVSGSRQSFRMAMTNPWV